MKKIAWLLRIIGVAFVTFSIIEWYSVMHWPTVEAHTVDKSWPLRDAFFGSNVGAEIEYVFSGVSHRSRTIIQGDKKFSLSVDNTPPGTKIRIRVNPKIPENYYYPILPPDDWVLPFAVGVSLFVFSFLPWRWIKSQIVDSGDGPHAQSG